VKKFIAVCTTALLAVGLALSGAGAATATTSTPEPCVPSDAWTETVTGTPGADAVYETVVVTEAGWQRYSWTGGQSVEAPAFPGAEWQANVAGDPHKIGVEGAYRQGEGNEGRGSWFYLEATPEITEEVLVTEAVIEVPDSYIEHEAVVCDEEEEEPSAKLPGMRDVVECGVVTLTFTNPTEFAFAGDYRVDDEAASHVDYYGLGDFYQIVNMPKNSTKTVTIPFDEDTGTHTVSYRIGLGAESDWYIGWKTLEVESDCILPPVPQECVVTYGDWFTEGDDTAPTENEDGLLFVGGVNDAMGVGIGIGGNLQGLPTISYDVEADAYSLSKFYPRIVIDSSADGGSSYNSMTVVSEGPVDGSAIASGKLTNGSRVAQTLDEWAAYYPNNTLRFFFLGTDSGSNADVSVLLKSVSSDCFSDTWGYGSQPPIDVVRTPWVDGTYDCDATTVAQTRTVTKTPYILVEGEWVLDTENAVVKEKTRERDLTEEEQAENVCPTEINEIAVIESVDKCGVEDDTYTVPETEGYVWQIDGETVDAGTYAGEGTVVLTAVAVDGFVFSGDFELVQTIEFTDEACPVIVPEEPVTPVVDRAPIAKADVLAYTGRDLTPFGIAAAIMLAIGSALLVTRKVIAKQ